MVRYPMEGRIGENDVKSVAPGHEAGVQHAEVHAGIELAGFCYHFRRRVQAGDGCRFLQQSVRQRTGSAAQVQNGLVWIFRYARRAVPCRIPRQNRVCFRTIQRSSPLPLHRREKGFFFKKDPVFFSWYFSRRASVHFSAPCRDSSCVGGREMVKISLL